MCALPPIDAAFYNMVAFENASLTFQVSYALIKQMPEKELYGIGEYFMHKKVF